MRFVSFGTADINRYESPLTFRIRWIGSTNFVLLHCLRVSRELSGLMRTSACGSDNQKAIRVESQRDTEL